MHVPLIAHVTSIENVPNGVDDAPQSPSQAAPSGVVLTLARRPPLLPQRKRPRRHHRRLGLLLAREHRAMRRRKTRLAVQQIEGVFSFGETTALATAEK